MPTPSRERILRAAGAGVLALCAAAALASTEPAGSQPVTNPLDFTGRTFEGLRLPVSPGTAREMEASFSAARVWAWSEPPETDAEGNVLPPVQRLLVSGDVAMRLGIYEVSAARALVWLRRLEPETVGGQVGLAQVFIYFDRVATPTAAPDPDAPITFNADRLSVEGVFRVDAPDVLRTDDFQPVAPPVDRFIREGERSLALRLRRLVADEPEPIEPGALVAPPGTEITALQGPDVSRPYQAQPDEEIFRRIAAEGVDRALPEPSAPIFARDGVFNVSAGDIVGLEGDPDEGDNTVVMITGGVVVQYHEARANRDLQISAERAVIYLAPQTRAEQMRFSTPEVLGIYVEGDVMASDGRYTLRAPRIYYDVELGRALVLDAVFWTYDRTLRMPLYLRAKTIRQESSEQFSATRATISNTAFFEPHLSLGASSVTIARSEKTPSGWTADARDITVRAGSIPFFYWPVFAGDPRSIPLRAIELVGSSVSGGGIRTAWDIPTLLGIRNTRGISAQLLLDAYFQRGLGIGTDLAWENSNSIGESLIYGLPHDTGTDVLPQGTRVEQDGTFRGLAIVEHQWKISDAWTLFLEGSYISDENFIEAFFEQMASNRREFRNTAYLRYLQGASEFTAQVKGSVNDFTPNEDLLQSQGYVVDRLPELTYSLVGDDLLANASPGLLTYFSNTRLGRVRFSFTEVTPADLGFLNNNQAQRAFGIDADESIGDSLRAEGLTEDDVTRFDTRHELTLPLRYGAANITPYVVGRVTAYDRDFEAYSGNDDQTRLWGETGVRLATTFQRIDDDVQSRFLDVNRIRHIVTPSATFSLAGTTIDRGELPVYDEAVEDINEGTTVRLGLEQTWQTKRGGPGRERSVDWFTLDSQLVFSSGDYFPDTPYPRYVGFRPELTSQGDFFNVNGTWQATEVLGLTASTTYDFNTSQQTRTAAGAVLRHSEDFSSFVNLIYSNPHDQTYVSFGAAYNLSEKYDLLAFATYDQDDGTIQNVNTTVTRLYPAMRLGLGIGYNNIRSETSFSFFLQPVGLGRRGATFRGIGSTNERAQRSSLGG